MGEKLGLRAVDDADGALEQGLGELGADVFPLPWARLEQEGGNACVARAAFVRIVTGSAYALDFHGAVPVRGRCDGASVGAEADQRRLIAKALARKLPDIVLAANLTHLGDGGVADMGVVRPDHGLGSWPAFGKQTLQRVEHVLITQIPRCRIAVIDGAVILFGAGNDARILLGVEESMRHP